MAKRGPLPNPNAARRNKRSGSSKLQGDVVTPPSLNRSYRIETVAWWEAWIDSPQSANFSATDWQRLLMLAPLVDDYWADPRPAKLAEIRQNESKLGATAEDRARLGWTIESPDDGEVTEAPPEGSRAKPDPRRKA